MLRAFFALCSENCPLGHDLDEELRSVVTMEMGFKTWTVEFLVEAPAERDLTRAPLKLSPSEAVAESPGRANATWRACGYKMTTDHRKLHCLPTAKLSGKWDTN